MHNDRRLMILSELVCVFQTMAAVEQFEIFGASNQIDPDVTEYDAKSSKLCSLINERYNADVVLRQINSSHGTDNCTPLSVQLLLKQIVIGHIPATNVRYLNCGLFASKSLCT